MSDHDHAERVTGCFRCDLSRIEVAVFDPPELHTRNPLAEDAHVGEIPGAPAG